MKFDRRRFLGFAAGASVGTALGVPAGRTLGDVVSVMKPAPVYPPGGVEELALSMCTLCPGGCGVQVRKVGGRIVKLEGNPLHPVNAGRLCPKGQAGLQLLNHPDRVSAPLSRTGSRGSLDSFEPSTWERALTEIGERLSTLRREEKPEGLVLLRGDGRGLGEKVSRRFMEAFGSANDTMLHRGDEAASLALQLGQGITQMPAYDLQSAEYVLCFGGALLEAWSSPVHTMRAYGEFRQGRPGRRGKLVQIEPRLSITGSSADEWIGVALRTEGVLALGIAAVLVSEGLYDREFVDEHTEGLEDFLDEDGNQQEGLRKILERDYNLESVSTATGVPVNTILRLAREFASSRAPLAVGPRRGSLLPGSLFDHLAVQWLNALAGNIDQPGGLLISEEAVLPSWPELATDPRAEERLRFDGARGESGHFYSSPDRLARAILDDGYPVEVLIVLDTDPLFLCSDSQRFVSALESIPLVVSLTTVPNDTALYADWILPEAHFLESWQLETTPPGVAYPLVSLAEPAVTEAAEPSYDVRSAAQFLLELAREIGDEVGEALPWEDLPALARSEVDALYGAKRGALMGTDFDEAWVRMMERAGWWVPGYESARELWRGMLKSGGWWDPFYDHSNWSRVLKTASGRHELQGAALPSRDDVTTDVNSSTEDSLSLLLFEPLPTSGGKGAELPFLQEILDPGHEARWETWVELHPESAGAHGVEDRDWVRVASSEGSLVASARVTHRVVPGVAALPLGLGKQEAGRWASGIGANPLRLVPPVDEREDESELTEVTISVVARAGSPRPRERRG